MSGGLGDRSFHIVEGRAIGEATVASAAIGEDVVFGRQRFGMVKSDVADLGRDGEGDGDEIVECRLIADLADVAVIVVVDAVQAAEALHHAGARWAEKQPVHGEEAGLGGVEKEIDYFRLGDVLL